MTVDDEVRGVLTGSGKWNEMPQLGVKKAQPVPVHTVHVSCGPPAPLNDTAELMPLDAPFVDTIVNSPELEDCPSLAEVPPEVATSDCNEASQERFAVEETLLIFDWDDTLLPSTWLHAQGLQIDAGSELTSSQREQLSELATIVAETLRLAKQLGTVVLVTNAEQGWVELSCQKFMPMLYPCLENVKILSARSTFETVDVPSPLDWKIRAFDSEIVRFFGLDTLLQSNKRKNLLSFGDSIYEREALIRVTSCLPNCRSKSLKFIEQPDVPEICKQHMLITKSFGQIVHHDGPLDLCLRCD